LSECGAGCQGKEDNFRRNSSAKQRFTIPESSITLPESAPNFRDEFAACAEFIDLPESGDLAVAGFHRNYGNRRPSRVWQLVAGGKAVLEPQGGIRADGACEW
jgi:hypothetical protein